jgi:Tat protein secretion system quality control protein TatD with DNase activity
VWFSCGTAIATFVSYLTCFFSLFLAFARFALRLESRSLRKPMFLHERNAQDDLFAILGEFAGRLPPVVCHCFTGSDAELARIVDAGFFVGVTGFVAMRERGEALRSIVARIPLDRLMVRAPALLPVICA